MSKSSKPKASKKPAATKPAAKKPAAKKPAAKKPALSVTPPPPPQPSPVPTPTTPLLSLSETPKHLQEVGARVVAARLVDGGRKRLLLAGEDEPKLAPFSFNTGWRLALAPLLDQLQASVSTKLQDVGAARPSATKVDAAMTQGSAQLKLFHTILSAGPHALAMQAPSPHDPHSPSQMSSALTAIADFVAAQQVALAPYGATPSFVTDLRQTATTLAQARTAHASDAAKVHPDVRATWQTAGVVFLELVRLSKVAHGVLSADRAKLYAMDELHPRQHHGANPPSPPASGASGTGSS